MEQDKVNYNLIPIPEVPESFYDQLQCTKLCTEYKNSICPEVNEECKNTVDRRCTQNCTGLLAKRK